MQAARREAPFFVLALAVAAAGALLLGFDSRLTFIADDWELLLVRDGWGPGTFLEPFNENIVVGPALVFKLLLATFGMDSAMPFYVASLSLFLASAVLLFALLRTRVGDWPALVAACLVLFLGAAFEDLLWAFQIGYFGSMAAGLGLLLALDRGNEQGDRIACALLVVSLAFSSLGLVFAVGALTEVALGRRPRARRLYVALLPLAIFALWWVGWGHDAESHLSGENIVHLPGYVYDAAAAGIVSLLGLATGDGTDPSQPHLIWGQLLVPVVVALVGWRVLRERGVPRGLAVAIVLALSFWVLAGLNRSPERFPTSSRYQLPSAVFLLLVMGEVLRGLRIPRLVVVAAAAVTVAAAFGGMSLLEREHEERWEPVADSTRSSLAAVDLAGDAADPGFGVVFPPSIEVSAATYLEAADAHGSPAYDEAELAARPEAERAGADLTMAQALGLALQPPALSAGELDCQTLAGTAETVEVELAPGQFTLANEGSESVEVMLGRFGEAASVNLGPVEPGVTTSLAIPADNGQRPWRLALVGAGPVSFCGAS